MTARARSQTLCICSQSRCHARLVQAKQGVAPLCIVFYNRQTIFSFQIATWPTLCTKRPGILEAIARNIPSMHAWNIPSMLKSGFLFLETGFTSLKQITRFLGRLPKSFVATTCTIWLRLEFRGLDSKWFSSAHLLFLFMFRGRFLSPRLDGWIQVNILAREPFWGQKQVPEKWFCDEVMLSWQFRGFPKTQMNSMVHRTHLGRLLCQKTVFVFLYFTGIYHFPGKLENAPACYPGTLPIPLVGLLW